jgi:hypothetical protein
MKFEPRSLTSDPANNIKLKSDGCVRLEVSSGRDFQRVSPLTGEVQCVIGDLGN